MKKILLNIIFGIVLCVFGYLLIANILHIMYLSKYDYFDFDSKPMADIKANIKELESNIEKISELNNTVFTEEDLKTIEDNFNNSLTNIKENKLLDYKGKQKIYLKDLFSLDQTNNLSISENVSMLKLLSNYDSTINNYLKVYTYDFINSAYNSEANIQEVIRSYRYNTLDYFNAIMGEATNTRILSRVYNLSYYVVKENYLAELVLETGGASNE